MNRNSAGISKFLGDILQSLQLDSVVVEVKPLSGGDIHDVYVVVCESDRYVVKVNAARMPADVFRLESAGLSALAMHSELRTPHVHGVTEREGIQALVLQYLSPSKGNIRNFSIELAKHHAIRIKNYGWEKDNYIGRLPQVNTIENSWEEFWSEHRIQPLVKALRDEGALQTSEVRVFEELTNRTAAIVPFEAPSLLHGDLWSGNVIALEDSYAVIDPAVYGGHREMDIAMMKLFGGFSNAAFEAYNEILPMELGWESRVGFHQIYPLLVHARLFGGLYIQQSVEAARRYL